VNLIQSVKHNIDMIFAACKTPSSQPAAAPTGPPLPHATQPPTARNSTVAQHFTRMPVHVFDEAEFVILELVKGNFYFTFIKTPEYLRWKEHHQQPRSAAAASDNKPAPAGSACAIC
jgi:hypothetical protein